MENYILIVRGIDPGTVLSNQDEIAGFMKQWQEWRALLDERGQLVLSIQLEYGAQVIYGKEKEILHEPIKNNGRMIGGYLIIKAENIDDATRIANDCPALELDGMVEVRAFKNVFHGGAFVPAN